MEVGLEPITKLPARDVKRRSKMRRSRKNGNNNGRTDIADAFYKVIQDDLKISATHDTATLGS